MTTNDPQELAWKATRDALYDDIREAGLRPSRALDGGYCGAWGGLHEIFVFIEGRDLRIAAITSLAAPPEHRAVFNVENVGGDLIAVCVGHEELVRVLRAQT